MRLYLQSRSGEPNPHLESVQFPKHSGGYDEIADNPCQLLYGVDCPAALRLFGEDTPAGMADRAIAGAIHTLSTAPPEYGHGKIQWCSVQGGCP